LYIEKDLEYIVVFCQIHHLPRTLEKEREEGESQMKFMISVLITSAEGDLKPTDLKSRKKNPSFIPRVIPPAQHLQHHKVSVREYSI